MDFVELTNIAGSAEARIVAGMLESHGIEAVVMNSPFNAVIPAPNIWGGYAIYVRKDQKEQAEKLLEEFGDTEL